MAETATTRPARTRASRAATPAKAAPAKAAKPAAKAEPAAEPTKTTVTRFTVELEPAGDTKSYSKFVVPDSYKGTVVGSIYAPLGTEVVKILVAGAGDTGE